jgi:hypothetical protein
LDHQPEEAVLLFHREDGGLQVEENEEYALVYLESRGPDRWLTSSPTRQLASLKRVLYPIYVIPARNGNGRWILDATLPVSITSFDNFNPAYLVAQLSYLVSQGRTAIDIKEETGQELFDHISGALLGYSRMQDDLEQDLTSTTSRGFISDEYMRFVNAIKPSLAAKSFRASSYEVKVSDSLPPLYSWEEALKTIGSIEGRLAYLVEYFRKCNDSIAQLEARVSEFDAHARSAKDELSKEFDELKSSKAKEQEEMNEECESSRQSTEKTYKPQLSKAEKQLKAASEATEAAQIELLPVQTVHDDMSAAVSRLQSSIDQTNAAHADASAKAEEFRAKYLKLQENQSNIQARSAASSDGSKVPEDTPLDAEMAYLERQALSYESKKQQLEEELRNLTADQGKAKAELEKFEETYHPIKEKADEAKASFEKRGVELDELRQRKEGELGEIEKRCQSETERIRSEVAGAESALGQRLPSIDRSLEGLKASSEKLKAALRFALKYSDENIQQGLEAAIFLGDNSAYVVYYPFYVASGPGIQEPTFITGKSLQPSRTAEAGTSYGSSYAPEAIDAYVQGRLRSLRPGPASAEYDLFAQLEFKGRILVGLKNLAKKGIITENKMTKLAKEVALIGMSLTQ